MQKTISKQKFTQKLHAYAIEKYGSVEKASESWGVTPDMARKMARGDRRPNEQVLKELGYQMEWIRINYSPECKSNKSSSTERYRPIDV